MKTKDILKRFVAPLTKNKKGVLGLDTAQAFVVGILSIVLISVVALIALNSLQTAAESIGPLQVRTGTNETYTGHTYPVPIIGIYSFPAPRLSVTCINNATGNITAGLLVTNGEAAGAGCIGTGNYTVQGTVGTVTLVAGSGFDGEEINITYTGSVRVDLGSKNIIDNASAGLEEMFTNATTWFTLIAVVIIILIIAVVIVVVQRFGGAAAGRGAMGGDTAELGEL